MTGILRHRRWVWAALVLMLVMVAVLVLHFGHSTAASAPLWNDRQAPVAPVQVQVPNWVELARALKPAVVNISTERTEQGLPALQRPPGQPDPFEPFLQQFFGNQPRAARGLGSGFIINPVGYVLTNNHVIDKATEIRVTLADGRQRSAKVIGRDPKTDLALLKIDGTGLPVIPLGDSSKLAVGAPVMAIGDPFGLEETVTTGIVSATSRVIGAGPYDSFIQTDASINPGNSGGPLINAEGQAIGVNADMFSAGGGSVGIGFAIPIDIAKPVVTQLAETGHVERGWLGVTIQPLTPALAKSFGMPNAEGALVASVMDDSPAQKAGLKRGDVIAEYNGRKVGRSESLPLVVAETPVGRHVPLTVYRDAKRMTFSVTIARLEEPRQERMVRAGSEKPALGLRVEALTLTPAVARQLGLSGNHGVVVKEVQGDGPAANAGIQPGDVIVEVDHHAVASATALGHLVERHAKGTPLLVRMYRDGTSLYAAIALS